jgi:hypothetical protein
LHLSEAEFLGLTPYLLDILTQRKYTNDRREATNAAMITATIINVNRAKNKRAVKIEDIIGKDISREKKKEATIDELFDLV